MDCLLCMFGCSCCRSKFGFDEYFNEIRSTFNYINKEIFFSVLGGCVCISWHAMEQLQRFTSRELKLVDVS